MPVLAYAATAVPATMDGGGVLYDTKDPFEVARADGGVARRRGSRRRVVAVQDAALDRLRAKDFGGTLLRFVDQVRALAAPAPEVPYDFWAMFDQAERLEELRQFRPAIYRALPSDVRSDADAGRSPVPDRTSSLRPAPSRRAMSINQWVPAAHRGRRDRRQRAARCATCCAAWGTTRRSSR